MLIKVCKVHTLMVFILVTGLLLLFLLIYNVKPPTLHPTRSITGNAASDNDKATGPPLYPDFSDPLKGFLSAASVLSPVRHQSSNVSAIPRTSQVGKGNKSTNTSSEPSAFRNSKAIGERILRNTIKSDFINAARDIIFTPGELVDPTQVRRVLILSSWRSGSSFLGDLLKSYPGTYYSFEPLHYLLKDTRLKTGPLVEEATNLIRSIFTCDLSDQDKYVHYMHKRLLTINHNTRLLKSCAKRRLLCFDKAYISSMCKYMPVNVMKTVRIGLPYVVELLEDLSLDLRVIHLVRDPRGLLHSRMKCRFCKKKSCIDPETVCNDLLTELELSTWVKERFKDRYMLLRYEDLGLSPEKKAKEIMAFLNLTYQKSVASFVKYHTTAKKDGAFSTYRNSKATTFAWRRALDYQKMKNIQELCKESLQLLGLQYFLNEEDYSNDVIPVLLRP